MPVEDQVDRGERGLRADHIGQVRVTQKLRLVGTGRQGRSDNPAASGIGTNRAQRRGASSPPREMVLRLARRGGPSGPAVQPLIITHRTTTLDEGSRVGKVRTSRPTGRSTSSYPHSFGTHFRGRPVAY